MINIFLSALTAFSWATTGIFVKKLGEIEPISLIWIRLLLSFFILYFIDFRSIDLKSIFSIKKSELIPLACSSIMTFYYIAATAAFLLAPVSLIALMISLSPIFTIFFRLVSKENVYWGEFLGCIVAISGMSIFLFFPTSTLRLNNEEGAVLLGVLLGALAAFLKAIYSFLLWRIKNSRKLKLGSPFSLSLKTFLIGSLIILPFVDLSDGRGDFSLNTIFLFLGLAGISTILPTFTNSYVSERLNPTLHTVMGISTPIFASFLAIFLLNESLSGLQIIGVLVVLSGIIITSLSNMKNSHSTGR